MTEQPMKMTTSAGTPTVKPRVALIGREGTGKTAVARALFGDLDDFATTEGLQRPDIAITLFDLPGWKVGGDDEIGRMRTLFHRASASHQPPYDLIWYTLDASSARLTTHEAQLIERIAGNIPVLVVLTRSDIVTADAVQRMYLAIENAHIPQVVSVVAVAADPLPTLGVQPYGLDDAINLTLQALAQPKQPLKPRVTPPAAQIQPRSPTPKPAPRTILSAPSRTDTRADQIVLAALLTFGALIILAQLIRYFSGRPTKGKKQIVESSRKPAKLLSTRR